MIPANVEEHLRLHHPAWEHHRHAAAMTAQELAANEHVRGRRVAKAVVVKLDGELALAVVAASDRVDLAALEEATARKAELATEPEFVSQFQSCEPGAEPPLALFGLPIFASDRVLQERWLLMPGGTHRDAILVYTHEWLRCEHVQPVANLGVPPS